ncbi:sulfite exporter TauE/SafE family protein [Radiobacillus sp. PE A8.2]|uniref:sulfite exporter TauE/SafE family protein n=1 Tax=Radiobacillus sp. PE A8.2 TaxID=3380349 RepID=UPI0038902C05
MWEQIVILFIIFLGSFIQGSSGFGFGLVCMGVISIFLSVEESMLIVLALTAFLSSGILLKYRRYIIWKDIVPITISASIGRALAFVFVIYFGETEFIKIILALVLISMVVYLYKNRQLSETSNTSNNYIISLCVGCIGGFIGGAFAIGGPLFVIYFLMRYEDKRSYTANLQLTFILLNLFTIVAHWINGDLTDSFYHYFILGTVIVLIGVTLGLKIFDLLSTKIIQNIAFTIITLAAINLIVMSLL